MYTIRNASCSSKNRKFAVIIKDKKIIQPKNLYILSKIFSEYLLLGLGRTSLTIHRPKTNYSFIQKTNNHWF